MDKELLEQLEKDKQRFDAWRAGRQGKEMIPAELWEVAVSYVSRIGLNQASRAFRINHTQLKQKAIDSGIVFPERSRKTVPSKDFVPFILPKSWSIEGVANGCPRLVLERADGRRLRIEGVLPDLKYLQAVAGCFYRG